MMRAALFIATRRTLADTIQRELCCTATLFTAFAAEAFVNDFLDVHLRSQVPGQKFSRIDRWPTLREYLTAVPVAYGPLFTDSERDGVIPHLKTLFEVRNALVHARPGIWPPMAWMADPSWRSQYSATAVARWLTAVAGAADAIEMRSYGFDYFSIAGTAIWQGRQLVVERAAWANTLPPHDSPDPTPLWEFLNAEIRRRNAEHPELRLTVHELRDSRIAHAQTHGAWDAFTGMVIRQRRQTGPAEARSAFRQRASALLALVRRRRR
jgi:hypothetical protein